MSSEANELRYFAARRDNGEIVHLTIRRPNRQELTEANYQFSRAFNEAMRHGLPTRKRQLKIVSQNGQWSEADDHELEKARVAAVQAEARLANLEKKAKESQVDPEVLAKARAERTETLIAYQDLRQEVEIIMSHTCDAAADNAYRNFLIAATVQYAEKDDAGLPVNQEKVIRGRHGEKQGMQPMWPTVEALMQEVDGSLFRRVLYEYTMLSAGLPSDWRDEIDEVQADNADAKSDQTDEKKTDEAAPDAQSGEPEDTETPAASL